MDINVILNLLLAKLQTWLEIIIQGLPNFVLALVVLVVSFKASKLVSRLLDKALNRIALQASVRNLALSASKISIISIGFFVALELLHLEKAVTSLLAGAGVLGLAIGFAFQDIAANFVSGIFIAFRKPYKIGDIIQSGDFMGDVTDISLRTTTVTTFQGLEVMMPNRMLFTDPITNYTNTPERRIDLAVGVSYGDDLQKVEDLLKSQLETLPNRIMSKEVDVFFTDFGDSSINLEVRVWVNYPGHRNYLITKSEAIKRVKKVFDDNDICIPYPIRTIDFGIKGGVSLSQQLLQQQH
jgi:small conductance mechanosensitive channel